MTPASERKAAERQRRKEAGLVRVEVWVKPERAALIKELAENLNKQTPLRDGWKRIQTGFGYIDIPLTPESP